MTFELPKERFDLWFSLFFIAAEEEIIAGPPLSPQCNAELHTDYDGAAVRWGLTHHKESAADCCQACLDQAKNAKPGELQCNIWVYCPSEFGCYSPDKYEHKHQECWLKQVSFLCNLYFCNSSPLIFVIFTISSFRSLLASSDSLLFLTKDLSILCILCVSHKLIVTPSVCTGCYTFLSS
jgi:hypothetical protein